MNCKPWHKDKFPSKGFTKHKKMLPKFPTSLDSRRWIFVKELLDDFRKGCPPCEDMITRSPKEGLLPGIAHRVPQHAPEKSQKKLPEEADLFSTLSPAQLARKAFVENIQAHLTKHPLALHPNLEEGLPADLLLRVPEVLDPDGKLEDTWAYRQGPRKRTKSPTELRNKTSCQGLPGTSKEGSCVTSSQSASRRQEVKQEGFTHGSSCSQRSTESDS
nr:protein FAM47E-like [Kogia breviceps]